MNPDRDGPLQAFRFSLRLGDPAATAAMPDRMADLRARIGDEAIDQVLRSMVLHRQPRPLTGEQAAMLRETVAPVLRDLSDRGNLAGYPGGVTS